MLAEGSWDEGQFGHLGWVLTLQTRQIQDLVSAARVQCYHVGQKVDGCSLEDLYCIALSDPSAGKVCHPFFAGMVLCATTNDAFGSFGLIANLKFCC